MHVYEYEMLGTCFISNHPLFRLFLSPNFVMGPKLEKHFPPKPETFTNQPQVKLGNTLYLSSIKHGTLRSPLPLLYLQCGVN